MNIDYIPLHFLPGSPWAALRELCGADEQSVSGTGAVDAIRLVDRLLVQTPGTGIGPGNAKKLTTADRDRLLAAIYTHTYGACIKSTVDCHKCKAAFDLDFSLEELVDHLYANTDNVNLEKDADGMFKLAGGPGFRLPTGEDEYRVLGLPAEKAEAELLARCIKNTGTKGKQKKLQDTMKALAPIVDIDMNAQCPQCQYNQKVHFDIQFYLLSSIIQERNRVNREIHCLAYAYGWGLQEILHLPRGSRKTLVRLIEAESGPLTGRRP